MKIRSLVWLAASMTTLVVHADRTISEDVTLDADADWRADGKVTIASGVTVSLNGHSLVLADLAGSGTIVGGQNLVQNGGFEKFTGTSSSWAYSKSSADAAKPIGWTESWNQSAQPVGDWGTGLTINNGLWLSVPPVDGARACFFQNYVTLSQTLTVPRTGTYTLSFSTVGRVGFNNLQIDASIDGQVVASADCAVSAQFVTTTVDVELTAGEHTLSFTGAPNSATGMPDAYRCGCVESVSLRAKGAAVVMDELTIEVPANQTVEVDGVELTGDLSFRKTGAGTLVLKQLNQTYAGVTFIDAGCVKPGRQDYSWNGTVYGSQSRVEIAAGAVLDLAGTSNSPREVVLKGGEMTSSSAPVSLLPCIYSLELTADSVVSGAGLGVVNAGYVPTFVNLNGHTLTLNIDPNSFFVFSNTEITGGGRLIATGGGSLIFGNDDAPANGGVRASTTSLEIVNAKLELMKFASTFKDYTSSYTGEHALQSGNGVLNVVGTFTPGLSWQKCELQDGATLDLRSVPGVWTNTCTFVEGVRRVTCAANATITVNLAERTLAAGDLIVRGVDFAGANTTLVCDAATAQAGGTLAVGGLGVYYGTSADFVATASWTGAAGNGRADDPANWSCYNLAGQIVADGLPSLLSAVRLEGNIALTTAAAYGLLTMGDCTLVGDCDLRACGMDVEIAGTVDLNGHRLQVSTLVGSGSVTDTTAPTSANCLANASFENYTGSLSHGNWGYFYLTSLTQATGWTSSGELTGNSPGLGLSNHNAWFSGAAPEGNVAAFFQNACTLSQTFTAPVTGTYLLTFAYTGRPGYNNLRLNFEFDGAALAFVDTPNTTFERATFGVYLTAGEHEFTIRGDPRTTTKPNERCAALDDLQLRPFTPGTLTVEVPAGKTLSNQVLLAGNLTLEKTGVGTFVAARAAQTHTGGNVVREGVYQAAFYDTGFAGAAYGRNAWMQVSSGAAFDMNGWANAPALLVLDGGEIRNEINRNHTLQPQLQNLVLLADSTVRGLGFGMLRQDYSATTCNLNGHVLTVDFTEGDSYKFTFVNTTVTGGGKIRAVGEGMLRLGWVWENVNEWYVHAAGTALEMGANASILASPNVVSEFGDYLARSTAETDEDGAGSSLKVYGRFEPGTRWHRCELQDGATLDLNGLEGVWSNACVFAAAKPAGARTVTFAENARVTVDVSKRTSLPPGGQVVVWDEVPTGVTFALDAVSREHGRYLRRQKTDGIYIGRGLIILVE